MLQRIAAQTAACRALCPEVEFVAEDAGRSEPEFLRQAIAAAVTAGAGIVTVCDTAGTLLPDEFFDEVTAIRAAVPAEVRLGVRCANTLFMTGIVSVYGQTESAPGCTMSAWTDPLDLRCDTVGYAFPHVRTGVF